MNIYYRKKAEGSGRQENFLRWETERKDEDCGDCLLRVQARRKLGATVSKEKRSKILRVTGESRKRKDSPRKNEVKERGEKGESLWFPFQEIRYEDNRVGKFSRMSRKRRKGPDGLMEG